MSYSINGMMQCGSGSEPFVTFTLPESTVPPTPFPAMSARVQASVLQATLGHCVQYASKEQML